MQLWGDYRRKYYIIPALIFLFIYFKLYSRADEKKKKQPLSSGSTYSIHSIHISTHICPLASILSSSLNSQKKRTRDLILCRFLLVIKMNHDHDHAAMLPNVNPIADGNHQTVGQGLHMMMMAVSIILLWMDIIEMCFR